MAKGILKKCTSCSKIRNCCCDFNKIDFPIVSKSEYEFFTNKLNLDKKNFSKINNECYNLIAQDGTCPFYKNKCIIYNNRPNDCKLFPFDIKIIDDKFYLILYKLDCFNHTEMLNENVNDIIEEIKPYIQTFASKELNQKMHLLDYSIIKEIKNTR